MKINLIGQDNNKFEVELIRYFENVNDKYLIYTKNEKDSSNFLTLYLTKVESDSGIRIGVEVSDKNEWSLIKNFLKRTIAENKEGKPVTIDDIDPIEVNDLKVNSSKPFKLQTDMVELFSKNQKRFEIVQRMREERNTAIPIPTETTEYILNSTEPEAIEEPQVDKNVEEQPVVEETATEEVEENLDSYKDLYDSMVEANKKLVDMNETLIKENDDLLEKIINIKELLENN